MTNPPRKGFLIKGTVQRAGFRDMIKKLAKSHNLFGFTENLKNYDEDVLVVCIGDENKISGFEKDTRALISDQTESINEKTQLKEKLDSLLTSEDYRGNTSLKHNESKQSPYHIENMLTIPNLGKYKDSITEAERAKDFTIIRDIKKETGERLDEGISALVALKNHTSNLNYDIIDNDFAILNLKYGALTDAVSLGFKSFPTEFAKAFDKVMDEKYGLTPKQKE
ncbi:MAG: acylphosphatase [Candidatus Altiarchaeota archaeon]|nr:acylphosphatase [Candidatus Altiarchaeota archaeon]